MGLNTILLTITFAILISLRLLAEDSRSLIFSRSFNDWLIDCIGLFIQGIIIPCLPLLIVPALYKTFPNIIQFEVSAWIQFMLSFVVLDYFYYWNHRIFHTKYFWHLHRLHHSSSTLDVFSTSRNSLITSFVFVYVWSQIMAMFFIKNPEPFLLGLALTFALDLWRHSGVKTPSIFKRLLGSFLILPEFHILHHSTIGRNKNFGANFNLWDKLHKTFSNKIISNESLERFSEQNIWQEIFLPRRIGK